MSDEKTEVSFPAQVWNTLSKIDVGDYIETKGDKVQLSYLPWSWAWAQLMNNYPESEFVVHEGVAMPDTTVSVRVEVIVRSGNSSITRTMWLPVMDHRNNAIQNPDTRSISDATMRCLVKCLALYGLGLDLYAKSDIPVGTIDDPINEDKVSLLGGMFGKLDETAQTGFLAWLGVDDLIEIPEGKYQSARKQLENKLRRNGDQ